MKWCTVWESIEVSAEHFYNKAQIKIVFCQNVLCISIYHFALKSFGQQVLFLCIILLFLWDAIQEFIFSGGEIQQWVWGHMLKGTVYTLMDNFHYLF